MPNKIAIYSCITGGYDRLKNPAVVDPRFDYICFTDGQLETCDNCIWQIKQLPKIGCDTIRLSRFPKMQPDKLMSEYDYTLYIDSNIQIVDSSFYDTIIDLVSKHVAFATIPHPLRDCIYDEAKECIRQKRDNVETIIKHIKYLLSERYPTHNGLIEANILLRQTGNEQVVATDNLWWEMINRFSRRDQLSLNYALWKNHFQTTELLGPGLSTWNHPALRRYNHGPNDVTVKVSLPKYLYYGIKGKIFGIKDNLRELREYIKYKTIAHKIDKLIAGSNR
jgi:hypothetical protein